MASVLRHCKVKFVNKVLVLKLLVFAWQILNSSCWASEICVKFHWKTNCEFICCESRNTVQTYCCWLLCVEHHARSLPQAKEKAINDCRTLHHIAEDLEWSQWQRLFITFTSVSRHCANNVGENIEDIFIFIWYIQYRFSDRNLASKQLFKYW